MSEGAPGQFTVELRSAEELHAPALAQMRAAFWSDQISKGAIDHPSVAPEQMLADTRSQLKRARTDVILATVAGQLIGYVLGQTRVLPGSTGSVSSVEEIFVLGGYRRSTVATQLVERLMSNLEAANAHRIQLRVLEGNRMAQEFWQRIGFYPAVTIYEYSKSDDSTDR